MASLPTDPAPIPSDLPSLDWEILGRSLDGFLLLDLQGRLLRGNPAACRLLGYPADELAGLSLADVEALETAPETLGRIERVRRRGHLRFVTRLRRRDGTLVDVEVSASYLPVEEGRLATFLRDLSDTVELRRRLDQSRLKYSTLFGNMENGLAVYEAVRDPSGAIVDFRLIEVNPAYLSLIQRESDEIVGKTIGETDPVDGDSRIDALRRVCDTRQASHIELFNRRLGRWFLVHCFSPAPETVATLTTDDTARKQMEERLAESEQQLRIIFDHTGTANSIFDTDCRLVRQNQLSVAALGMSEDRARGLGVRDLFGEARGALIEGRMRRVLATCSPEVFETEFELLTGTKTFRSAYQPLLDGTQVVGVQLVSQDITEQVTALKALRDSETQFRTVFELAADLVCIAGLDGFFRLVNPAGRTLLQYPEDLLYSKPFLEFIVPEDRQPTQQVIDGQLAQGCAVLQFENRYQCADGRIVFLEWVAQPDLSRSLIFAVARNVTERKRFEAERQAMDEQIRKTQKLESLGILAGGIAHDFNNLLAAILSFADLAVLHAEDDRQRHYLERVVAGCHRAQSLTRQLLTFSRGGTPVTQPTDLGALVEAAVPFASHGSRAQVSLRVVRDLPPVDCDPEQIGQVVSNLVINALQAMDQGGALEVVVEAGWGQPPNEPAPVSGVFCRFTDTGPGIAPELLDRIFDPFFTTKSSGSGLGLSICHSIVRSHRGMISVTSEPGRGAVFQFWLPQSSSPAPADRRDRARVHQGAGTALVLDDQEAIREAVVELLRSFGYQPVAVATCTEALEQASAQHFALAVLDLTLPGEAGGAACAQELRRRGFGGGLLAMSGYSHDTVLAHPADHGFDGALVKPFSRDSLSAALERIPQNRLDWSHDPPRP